MKNNVTTNLTFTASDSAETASCTVSFVQNPDALILTPSRTSLIGTGVVALTGNKEITGIMCSNSAHNEYISGSGTNWAFNITSNTAADQFFEATVANCETVLCWVRFKQYTPPTTRTVCNDDGTSTRVVTDNRTGTVETTTVYPDGSTSEVEVAKDGDVTSTLVLADDFAGQIIDSQFPGAEVAEKISLGDLHWPVM